MISLTCWGTKLLSQFWMTSESNRHRPYIPATGNQIKLQRHAHSTRVWVVWWQQHLCTCSYCMQHICSVMCMYTCGYLALLSPVCLNLLWIHFASLLHSWYLMLHPAPSNMPHLHPTSLLLPDPRMWSCLVLYCRTALAFGKGIS